MTEAGFRWLRDELAKPTKTEILVARCEKARDLARDPDIKIIWECKARELRDKNHVKLDKVRRENETF